MTLDQIRQARSRIAEYLAPTPVIRSDYLSRRLGFQVLLKLETMQPTGSFKVRPALNGALAYLEQARTHGVVASSSGNFAQAVAWACTRLGVDAQVVMMRGASALKRERTRTFGATVIDCEDTFASRWETTYRIVEEAGRVLLHPYDSDETVAGDGVIGVELIEQVDGDFTVVAPISGGGLIGGVAAAVKQLRPASRVVGVQAEANPSMRLSLDQGVRATTTPEPSLADALAVATPGERGFALCRRYVDDVALVTEAEMEEAVRILAVEHKLVVEGGGATGVAALLAGRVSVADGPAVCVVSGGNIAPRTLARTLGT